jgi:hypothetical protein
MSFDPQAVIDVLASHATATGFFERVGTHEPKNAPGNGLTCAIWADRIDPALTSGLASTSIRVTFAIRVLSSMTQEPQDAIDPNILNAVSGLFAAYNGDFELGGEARHIDIFGHEGDSMYAEAGYVEVSGRMFRLMQINMPVIFNDAFDQAP